MHITIIIIVEYIQERSVSNNPGAATVTTMGE